MRRPASALSLLLALAMSLGCTGSSADAEPESGAPGAAVALTPTIESHVAAAEAAAGDEHTGLLDRICPQATSPVPVRGGGGGGGGSQGPPPRSEWYAEPVRVFDDLVFLGQSEYTAWGVLTSAGIIVIDPIYDWSVEAEVVEGLTSLGLDPNDIEYVLVSHAHRDHVGGAALLQERFGARVVMGEGDWEMLERNTGAWPRPTRDVVATDGMELTLGETTLKLYVTPGHTPTTISSLVPVRDGESTHLAALWGGTAFNFLNNPDEDHERWYQAYIDSAVRFRALAAAAGADVLISNHSNFDGSKTKLPALAARSAGAPHPYVIGNESVGRYLTVAEECGRAGLLYLGANATASTGP